MRRLIYASASVQALTSGELDEIALQAQRNNIGEDITGLLLYGDQSFFQVLEGPPDNIEAMKKRLWGDTRHRGISVLEDKEVGKPAFAEWSMGCYRLESVPVASKLWPIVNFESIESHLPEKTPPEILVFARVFFSSIGPRTSVPGLV